MAPNDKDKIKLSTRDIVIVVVAVIIGIALIFAAISWILRRRKRRAKSAKYMQPKLRGGKVDDHEVVEFMKSGSIDSTLPKGFELDSRSRPSELGYTTRPLSEVPMALQPGQANTALPAYSLLPFNVPHVELEDTSRRELPPTKSDEQIRPMALNFSRPSRDTVRLSCKTQEPENAEDAPSEMPKSLPSLVVKSVESKRVSSPTIPPTVERFDSGHERFQRQPSPVSPLMSPASPPSGRPRRVSFVSPLTPSKTSELSFGSNLSPDPRPMSA